MQTSLRISLAAVVALILGSNLAIAQYTQTNLVADVKGHAIHTDPVLVNAWGLAFFPHGLFLVANEGSGTSTAYGPNGKLLSTAITIPVAPSHPVFLVGSPTGLVANPTHEFVISKDGKSGPARFIFDTIDGLICGWNPDVDPDHAITVIDYSVAKPNAKFPGGYGGLAIGRNSKGQNVIYATDGGQDVSHDNNEIDMFDGDFNYLGSFTDPVPEGGPNSIPTTMGSFGIQNIDNKLYVSFAGFGDNEGGFVDVFDMDGKFLRRFGGNLSEGPLQAPWGFAMAPSHFGKFSHALLIGNLEGDRPNEPGRIKAYDPNTGAFLGVLRNRSGRPIEIGGLWALAFGTDKNANGATNELFFTAGPTFPPNTEFEADGLFGVITAAGEDDQ
jgi:uncharacterized protein (TIGR03118 family)